MSGKSVLGILLKIFDAYGIPYRLENGESQFRKLYLDDYGLLIIFTASGSIYASQITK